MMLRSLATMLISSSLLLSAAGALPATAATATAMRAYSDSTHSISLQYPSTWKLMMHVKSSGYTATLAKTADIILATDTSAFIGVIVQHARLSPAAVQSNGLKLYKEGVTVTGPIATGHMMIGKTAVATWSGKTKDSTGSTTYTQMLYVGVGSKDTVYLGIATSKNTAATTKAVQTIVSSISIQ